MNCEQVRESLYPFLDNELDEGSREAVLAHLGSCWGCAEIFEAEKGLKRLYLQKLGYEAAPEHLRYLVEERLKEVNLLQVSWKGLAIAAGILVAIALVLFPYTSPYETSLSELARESVLTYLSVEQDRGNGVDVLYADNPEEQLDQFFTSALPGVVCCFHQLQGIGYRYSGGSVCMLGGRKKVPWVTQYNLETGAKISHTFVQLEWERIQPDGAERLTLDATDFYLYRYMGFEVLFTRCRCLEGCRHEQRVCIFVTRGGQLKSWILAKEIARLDH